MDNDDFFVKYHFDIYSRLPITRTFKGNGKKFELATQGKILENNLKGNVNCFELAGGSSYRGLELLRFDRTRNEILLFFFV